MSVVIPTYNGAAVLPAALRSVFAQTVLPTEIVVVDDCSRDDTLETAERVSQESTIPMRVLRLPRNSGGPATPLNYGIKQATGTHIAVLEQDDEMPATCLALHAEAHREMPDCELSFGRFELVGVPEKTGDAEAYNPMEQLGSIPLPPIGQRFVRLDGATLLPQLLKKNIAISNSNLFFARSLWHRIGGFDTRVRVTADWNFMLAAAQQTPMAFINAVCLSYHYSPTSLSRVGYDDRARRESGFLHEMRLRYPVYAGSDWWQAYWSERHQAKTALKAGRLITFGSSLWLLLRTGALWHHLSGGSKLTVRPAAEAS